MANDTDETVDQQADETEEQSTQDQAGDEQPGVKGDEGTEQEEQDGEQDGGGDEEEVNLLSDDEFKALQNDPAKLRKELNRAATKKFQETSALRKRLEPYAGFVDAFEEDPRAAVTQLAKHLGVDIQAPKSEAQSEAAVKKLSDRVLEKVKAALGPEYEDLSERIAAAVQDSAQLVVDETVKPLKEEQNQLLNDSAARETATELEAFGKRHPDWKKYEGKITELSNKLKPGEGMTAAEYLDNLYALASAPGKQGDATKKALKRMNESASKSDNSRSLPASAVSKSPAGKLPTFAESAAAARRGETLD